MRYNALNTWIFFIFAFIFFFNRKMNKIPFVGTERFFDILDRGP